MTKVSKQSYAHVRYTAEWFTNYLKQRTQDITVISNYYHTIQWDNGL